MQLKDMAPWKWGRKDLPLTGGEGGETLQNLQRRMNETFDDFFRRFPLAPSEWNLGWREFSPRVNVSEKDNVVTVEAEVPGMDEKDVDVTVSDNVLTLRGERKQEHTEEHGHTHRREITYGAFQRTIPLPRKAKADEAQATFSKGVLRIVLPLEPEGDASARSIRISAE